MNKALHQVGEYVMLMGESILRTQPVEHVL